MRRTENCTGVVNGKRQRRNQEIIKGGLQHKAKKSSGFTIKSRKQDQGKIKKKKKKPRVLSLG